MGNAQEISADEEGSVELHGLASWWRSGPEWDAALAEVEAEDEPAQLNTANSAGGFNLVSLDKLSVRYPGHPHHAYDVGAVQADRPAPARRLLYYFEMTVDHAGAKGLLAIGFTPPGVKMCRQPGSVALHRERASELEHSTVFQFFCFRLRQLEHPTVFQFFCLEFWEENSCGYRGDDGMIYRGQETGESFGPTFAAGDTVGAGINYAAQEFFFTKNGHLVGAVAKNAKGPLFPTVAVHSQNEQVTVNFGKHPFLFNIEAYALEERTKQLSAIEKSILPVNVSHWIVRSYLLHYGYEDTLNSFDTATGDSFQPAGVVQENAIDLRDTYALNHRKTLRQLIRAGEIDSAMEKLQQWYPQTVQNETNTLCFLLRTQKFIEYIRIGELEAAVKFARAHLAKFFSIKSLGALLQNCIALLAYDQPAESCVGYLLDVNQRELVADAVNVAVLLTNSASNGRDGLSSRLEKLLRQLTTCCAVRRDLSGDQGETFHLHQALHSAGRRTSLA
ncbi:ran-binding protein M homolog isoform X1 [Wolffia australiana]